jgi:hypothetical protein
MRKQITPCDGHVDVKRWPVNDRPPLRTRSRTRARQLARPAIFVGCTHAHTLDLSHTRTRTHAHTHHMNTWGVATATRSQWRDVTHCLPKQGPRTGPVTPTPTVARLPSPNTGDPRGPKVRGNLERCQLCASRVFPTFKVQFFTSHDSVHVSPQLTPSRYVATRHLVLA